MLIAMSADGLSSPKFDNDFVSELLYPDAMKKVIVSAGNDPVRQKDVRIQQNITVTAGTGTLPANAVLECLETAVVNLNPVIATDPTWDASTDVITVAGHGYWTGMPLTIATTGVVGGGLAAGTTYYVIYVSASTFKLATSLANAVAGTAINISLVEAVPTNTWTPTFTRGSASFVPNYFDYTRALFAPFCYWTVKSGSFYALPAGATLLTSFAGVVPFESVVFPTVVAGQIDIVSGTALAEDICDDIVIELAAAIRAS